MMYLPTFSRKKPEVVSELLQRLLGDGILYVMCC